jgi:hypothetical protein
LILLLLDPSKVFITQLLVLVVGKSKALAKAFPLSCRCPTFSKLL